LQGSAVSSDQFNGKTLFEKSFGLQYLFFEV